MSELKKDDLVFHKNYPRVLQIDIEPVENDSHIYCLDLTNNGEKVAIPSPMLYKPTRSDVEEYINGLGWEETVRGNWNKPNINYFLFPIQGNWVIRLDGSLFPDFFDTAPQQLAEAIMVARLLNATKD